MRLLYSCALLFCAASNVIATDVGLEYRLDKVNSRREQALSIPTYKSTENTLALISALIDSEKEFWEDCRQELLMEYERLSVIVNLLDNPKNKINLEVRFQLFTNSEQGKLDEQLYQRHQNIQNALSTLQQIQDKFLSVHQISLEAYRGKLLTETRKLEKENESIRQLYNHSSVPEINRQIKQSGYRSDAYRRLDVITTGFAGFLIRILNQHIEESQPKRSLPKKEKRQPIQKKNIVRVQPLQPSPQQVEDEFLIESSGSWGAFTEEHTSEPASLDNTSLLLIDLMPEVGEHTLIEPTPKLDESNHENIIEEESIELEPWKKYTGIKKKPQNDTPRQLSPIINAPKLDQDQWYTVGTLLRAKGSNPRDKVSMKSFVEVITALGGNVCRGPHNVHFIMPNIYTGKMVSSCMHSLHGDKSHFIPPNTYYWKRAALLLERAGFLGYLDGRSLDELPHQQAY